MRFPEKYGLWVQLLFNVLVEWWLTLEWKQLYFVYSQDQQERSL